MALMHGIVVFCSALLLAMAMPSNAQERPDFSGRWVLAHDRASVPMPVRVVKQDDRSLTVEDWSAGGSAVVYNLDGTERQETFKGVRVVSKAQWRANELITAITFPGSSNQRSNGQTIERTETWSLDRNGMLGIVAVERRSGMPLAVAAILVYRRE